MGKRSNRPPFWMRAWVTIDNFINMISPLRWGSLLVGLFFCAVEYRKLMRKQQWTDGPNGWYVAQKLWPYRIFTFGWAYHVKIVRKNNRWERSYRRWFYANSGQDQFTRYLMRRIVNGDSMPNAWVDRRR